MTATFHTLHPDHAAKIAPDTPAGKILLALEQMASSVMTEQLRVMFEGADTLLFEMADKAGKGAEQQAFIDAMRVVRVQRPRMVSSFQEALHKALQRDDHESVAAEVDLDDLDSWSLQDASDLEEKIAISNMVSKVNTLYATQLTELEQRMTRLSEQAQGAVSPQALSGGRILEAFQHSMKQLDLETPIKLVIYKLFDLTVVSRLGTVFTGANQVLDANGLKPADKPPKKKKPPPARRSLDQLAQAAHHPAGAASDGPAMPYGPAPASAMHHYSHFAAALQPYLAAAAARPGGPPMNPASFEATLPIGPGRIHHAPPDPYANSQLATEMLALMEAVGQGQPVESWMPAQNLSLVGRMFDDMYTDSRLTDAARPMLGRLQFPAMKVALADPTFFSNPTHPVRSLVNDVFDTLTTDGAATGADLHRLEELIQELLKRFDLDPTKLRNAPAELASVSESEAEHFLEQQKRRLDEQRKTMREKVRRIVSQELRLHLGDRRLPKPAMKLLLSGFGPLLVRGYRHGGPTGPEWQGTLLLMDRVLESFDPAAAAGPRAELEDALCTDVRDGFTRVGMPPAKVEMLCERLREAYADFAAEPPPVVVAKPRAPADATAPASAVAEPAKAAPAAPVDARHSAQAVLHMLLSRGEWFRVWDATTKACRWLKLLDYYGSHDCVVFEDFAGENRLQMKASVFGHDLAAGRSLPVNPNPTTADLIKRLPPAPAVPVDSGASWFSLEPPAKHAA